MKIKGIYLYLLLIIIHTGISIYAFEAFFRDPHNVIYCNSGDGLKNYFTLFTYVNDPVGKEGITKYERMNYPYGDYVYALDNTPGFSVPFKWYCRHVRDVSGNAIILFNLYVIFHIIIAGVLAFFVFRNLLKSDLFAFMSAVAFPWMNIQLPRIWNGHYNLSFFSLILAALCLLIVWHKNRGRMKRYWLTGLLMVLLCVFSFFQHGYYVAIVTIFIAGSLFAYGLLNRKQRYGIRSIIASVTIPALTLSIVLLVLKYTDGYLDIRSNGASGYDYYEMKTRLSNLFTPYFLHHFYFPIRSVGDGNHEHAAYLGNISLYAVLIIGLLLIFKKQYRQQLKDIQHGFFSDTMRLAVIVGGLLMLSISMGEVYYTGPDGYYIYNILNPFFYLHQLTTYVEQFRALGRFNWPFFLVFNVWAIYTISELYKQHNTTVRRGILVLFIVLGFIEVKDFINELRRNGSDENYLNAATIQKEFSPLKLSYDKYQAILPIPYYNTGSEVMAYTIDDYEPWCLYNYKLSIYSGLPNMGAKMSRTPPKHARALLDIVAYDIIDTSLQRLLNNKPVLVALNKTYVSTNPVTPGEDQAKAAYYEMNKFAERHQLQAIDSMGDVLFFEWYPKQ